jgi:hypothetical protein
MYLCASCGQEVQAEWKVCLQCGGALGEEPVVEEIRVWVEPHSIQGAGGWSACCYWEQWNWIGKHVFYFPRSMTNFDMRDEANSHTGR